MSQSGLVWEQRWHPLRGEWVLFTSHRSGRPWVGETVPAQEPAPPCYDPQCALCPGNRRMHEQNPPYQGVYWFANDLPCFSTEAPDGSGDAFYEVRAARGAAEVVCYHPDHSKTFADLTSNEAGRVVEVWTERYRELGARPEVEHVLIFENKGALVGTSNPHPHCQIYAGNLVYGHIAREVENSCAYFERTGRPIGQEIRRREAESSRVICENDSFLACVPWFARYAYEVLILPKRQVSSLVELTADERRDLGESMREVAVRYDNLWQRRLPYVMALHQAPTDGADYSFFPFHIEYHPPLRKPDTMKYLAGPEIGGGSMTNESNPDEKAAELRAVSTVLYRQRT
jgi:UDPglucose--hexose-1-phosphate uridylyltransferase